jgi:DNA-binding XRE family transcriptional regulator
MRTKEKEVESAIKNNLHKYRIWKNITQEQLASDLKISVSHLRDIECHSKYPKYQIRSRLCKYFDVSQDQMFYYEEGMK